MGKKGSCAGYGMSALEDIEVGEELFRVPQQKVISWETLLDGLSADLQQGMNRNNVVRF